MSELTPHQQAVVNHNSGHARVIAVAGAGKTTTLAHFIAARLDEAVPARRMLVLMYNKSAQQDFQQKLRQLTASPSLPEVRTFHSLGLKIYQRLVADGHLPPFDRALMAESELDTQVWRLLQQTADEDTRQDVLSQRKKWVEPAMAFIDRVKSGLDSPEQQFEALDLPPRCRFFLDMFERLEAWRKAQRRISFADMLYDPVRFLLANPEVAHQYAGHMHWLLVDEYQDINDIQYQLLNLIRGDTGQLLVIGDPDQTIYEFRGSRPSYMTHEFERSFPEAVTYPLPHSFRYGHQLALMANSLIYHNADRAPVVSVPGRRGAMTRVHQHAVSSSAEAAGILKLVQQALVHRAPDEIAIVARLWALCAPIELAFLQAGVRYRSHTRLSVLDRWELNVFWLLLEIAKGDFSHRDQSARYQAWLLLLTTPFPKIRRAELEALAERLSQFPGQPGTLGANLQQQIPKELSRWQRQQLETRAELLAQAEMMDQSAFRLCQDYFEQTEMEQGIEEGAFSAQQIEDRLQTIKAFIGFLGNTGWSASNAWGELDALRAQHRSAQNSAGVHLISAHKSKGLEWPVVIIPGLNHHYFPYQSEGEFSRPANEESERRLLYVAMTRAREELHLLVPAVNQGKTEREASDREQPSRFQGELAWAPSSGKATEDRVRMASRSPDWWNAYQEVAVDEVLVEWDSALNSGSGTSSRPIIGESARRKGSKFMAGESGAGSKPALKAGTRTANRNRSTTAGKTKKPASNRDRRQVQWVRHRTLGKGEVVEQRDQYLVVRFEGDQLPRTLDMKVAKPMLTWL
jgi:DNA helicase-2/ATP-dependent DNA helicase PcrA